MPYDSVLSTISPRAASSLDQDSGFRFRSDERPDSRAGASSPVAAHMRWMRPRAMGTWRLWGRLLAVLLLSIWAATSSAGFLLAAPANPVIVTFLHLHGLEAPTAFHVTK